MIFCDISSVIWREISEFYVYLKIQGFLEEGRNELGRE